MALDLIAAHLDYLRQKGRAERTRDAYGDTLHRIHRDLPHGLDLASEEELKAWIYRPNARYPEDWKPSTIHRHLAAARSFFGWATLPGAEYLDYDPTATLPIPTVPKGLPRPPTDAQVRRALASPDPYWLWFRLASHEGLRCCEIVRLDRRDITQDDTFVHGKGAKERVVPTDRRVWAKVESLPAGRLVEKLTGGPATAHYLSQTVATYFDEMHMPEVTAHRLRHWYATRTLEACGDLRVVQELLGHESPVSTAIYTQITGQQKRSAVAGLPDLD